MAARLITLRYPGACVQCGDSLAAGSEAWWNAAAKTATCPECHAPADPFARRGDLRGEAGGAAQKKADFLEAAGRDRHTVEAWQKGADGERRLAGFLASATGKGDFALLHDRRIPGSKANLDHLAIAPTGVYVIDAKNYEGEVVLEAPGIGRWRQESLKVKGRDRTRLVDAMTRQVEAVAAALGPDPARFAVPIKPVLCFVDSDWELFFTSFTVKGVLVTAPRPLRRTLRKAGPLRISQRSELAALLAERLPPAVVPTKQA